MTPTPPDPESRAPDLNPVRTMLLKIAGILILAVAGVILIYFVLLMVAFGGSDPWPSRLISVLREPVVWGYFVFVALGVGLVLHARRRDRAYRHNVRNRRRMA